jgi:hypothetical protein
MVRRRSANPCACGSRSERVDGATLVEHTYRDGEWVNQFEFWEFDVNGERAEVWRNTLERFGAWSVIWEGAVDFNGNKKDLVQRYPEFRRYL